MPKKGTTAEPIDKEISDLANALVRARDTSDGRGRAVFLVGASPVCHACPHLNVCGGGMLTHRYDDKSGYHNPSVFCADQKLLIAQMKEVLAPHLNVPVAA